MLKQIVCGFLSLLFAAHAHAAVSITFSDPHLDKQVIPRSLATGANGVVWYSTERFTPHAIGRIENGKVTEFAIPCEGCESGVNMTYIEDLVEGADGKLYFLYTEVASDGSPLNGGDNNYVGVLTPSSSSMVSASAFGFTKIRIATPNAFKRFFNATGYASIAAAPDRVCFSENAADKLGCLSYSSQALIEIPLPSGSFPSGITYASGAMWNVLTQTGKLVKLDSSNHLTTFDLPGSNQFSTRPFLIDVIEGPNGLLMSDRRNKTVWEMSFATNQFLSRPLTEGNPLKFAAIPDELKSGLSALVTNPDASTFSVYDPHLLGVWERLGDVIGAPFDAIVIRRPSVSELFASATGSDFHDVPLIHGIFQITDPCSNAAPVEVWVSEPYLSNDNAEAVKTVGVVGRPFVGHYYGHEGTAPYTFQLVDGQLPAGLTLHADGSVTGTPVSAGVSAITLRAIDAKGCSGERTCVIEVKADCSYLQWAHEPVTVSPPYFQFFLDLSAQRPITLMQSDLTSAKLESSGLLSGTLTGTLLGDYTFSITVLDGNGCIATGPVTLRVQPPPPPRRRAGPF